MTCKLTRWQKLRLDCRCDNDNLFVKPLDQLLYQTHFKDLCLSGALQKRISGNQREARQISSCIFVYHK